MSLKTWREKVGLAEMLKGGVIMDVVNPEQARIAEDAGAVAVMALERVPADIRRDGGGAPVADIESAHRSSCLPLLGMLSYKAGRSIQWDGAAEQIVGDPDASKLLSRPYRGPWVYPKV
mgnify:CR=1 FL=1